MLVQSERTVVTLSNALTLTADIINKVSGTEVADTLNGSVVSRQGMNDLISSEFNKMYSQITNKSKGV